jgi:hypothetical protein
VGDAVRNRRGGAVVNAVLDRTDLAALVEADGGCWTTEYALRHCEGYVVDGHEGHIGLVSDVIETGDGLEFVVQTRSDELHVTVGAIERLDSAGERIVIAVDRRAA